MKLEGKVAIVTGGGQGIGQGIVHCLAEEGADIAIIDMNKANANKVVDEVKTMGRSALAVEADVTKSNQVNQVVQEVADTFGKIDILVNVVGGSRVKECLAKSTPAVKRFVDIDEEEWDSAFEFNMKSQFLMCRAVVPYFLKQKNGKIVNLGSRLAKISEPRLFAYSIAKPAVVHFTRVLATELAQHNINVNCVCPGDVLTPRIEQRVRAGADEKGMAPEEYFTEIVKTRTPLQRLQTPEDMGHSVVFLASEDSRNITGHSFYVDGGQVMY